MDKTTEDEITMNDNRGWAYGYVKQVEMKFPEVKNLVKLSDAGVTVKMKNGITPLGYLDEKFKELLILIIKQALDQKV